MNYSLGKIVLSLFVFVLGIWASVAHAELAIIAHKSTSEIGIAKSTIADMFLGKKKVFKNGERIQPVDQAKGSAIRAKFYRNVLRKSEGEVNRYWSKLKYTGKGRPPKVLNGDAAVKEWVALTPGAIGYIQGKYLDKSVKVLLILP